MNDEALLEMQESTDIMKSDMDILFMGVGMSLTCVSRILNRMSTNEFQAMRVEVDNMLELFREVIDRRIGVPAQQGGKNDSA